MRSVLACTALTLVSFVASSQTATIPAYVAGQSYGRVVYGTIANQFTETAAIARNASTGRTVMGATALANYNLAGSGLADAALSRNFFASIPTAAGRAVQVAATDSIVPGAANIARNVARAAFPLAASAITGTAGLIVVGILAEKGIDYAVDHWQKRVLTSQDVGPCGGVNYAAGGPPGQVQLSTCLQYWNSSAAAASCTSLPVAEPNGNTSNGRPDQQITCISSTPFAGFKKGLGTWSFAQTSIVSGPPNPAVQTDLQQAVQDLPANDSRGSQALKWLKDANYDFDLDGSEKARLTAQTVQAPAFDSSTVTNPDGSVTTTYQADKITPSETGHDQGVDQNAITFGKTVVTSNTANGQTTTTEETTPKPQEVTDPNGCGNTSAGQPPCATKEVGTFAAPSSTLPIIPEAPTFQASLTRFWNGLQAAPLVAMASGIHLPSGAACPTASATVPILDIPVVLDAHCPILESIRGILSTVCIFVWGFLGIRRVMSA